MSHIFFILQLIGFITIFWTVEQSIQKDNVDDYREITYLIVAFILVAISSSISYKLIFSAIGGLGSITFIFIQVKNILKKKRG